MCNCASVQKIVLPLAIRVTPNEGTEGGAMPLYDVDITVCFGSTPASALRSWRGIAPWDALWASSHATNH